MAKINILELNVAQLFHSHSVQDIQKIEKFVDAEIELKRVELRLIVGDRYKDILTATEAIKSIESISECIVADIQKVLFECDAILKSTKKPLQSSGSDATSLIINGVEEERTILIQIRLVIELNEHIWLAIDEQDFCKAAQFYLLAQHVHTGLRLLKADMMQKYRFIAKIKLIVDKLRAKVLNGCLNALENVEIGTQETCSVLNAIMLLESHSSIDLLQKFITIRKNALESVIKHEFPSVRTQVAAMVKCIYTTWQLLHDCFFNYNDSKEGLIWSELNAIIGNTSLPTLMKISILPSNLSKYIPTIIKEFRPKCSNTTCDLSKSETRTLIRQLQDDYIETVGQGLSNHLDLVHNIKGLHLIREEALKIEFPKKWEEICQELDLERHFDVWYSFFQGFLTQRVHLLISNKIADHMNETFERIAVKLSEDAARNAETDLRPYIWHEKSLTDERSVLSMKTKGFSATIVALCQSFDAKFLHLVKDFELYFYGKEFNQDDAFYSSYSNDTLRKFADREKLETHLKQECAQNMIRLIEFLEIEAQNCESNVDLVSRSILCARFLSALPNLCPNFIKCSSCNHSTDDWAKILANLNKSVTKLWDNWINICNAEISTMLKQNFNVIEPREMLKTLYKWDTIEIQEQTDERVFKSQIKIPMKSSMALECVLHEMTKMLNMLFPHTLPKQVHSKFVETSVFIILQRYEQLQTKTLNQMQALQFLFDVKYLTMLTVPRENMSLVQRAQDVCDKFRSFVDPFDLDVFYKYLTHNVRQNALQSQTIFGCLLPSSQQLASLGMLEKNKEHEKDPSIIAMATPASNNWFMLLPVTAPTNKMTHATVQGDNVKINNQVSQAREKPRKGTETSMRSGAAALFGAMTNDWFS